jgi:hypothetical protein
MEKIYLFLLNRKPSQFEISNNKFKSLSVINQEITKSEEYSKFTEHIKDLIVTNYSQVFNINKEKIKLNSLDLFEKMKFIRNNKYNLSLLNNIIKKSLVDSIQNIKVFLGKFPNNNLIHNNIFIQNIYLGLIESNFNYLEMECNIINSKEFNDYFV